MISAAFSISETLEMVKKRKQSKTMPVTVILDEIRDPINLGSIIRTMAAANVNKIILTKGKMLIHSYVTVELIIFSIIGCCDIWDSKVMRSCCGGHFKMHIETRAKWPTLVSQLPSNSSVYIAEAEYDKATQLLQKEMNDLTKGICMEDEPAQTELTHEQKHKLIDESMYYSELSSSYEINDESNDKKIYSNEGYEEPEHLEKFSHISLPSKSYSDAKFFRQSKDGSVNEVILVIGGETGLSLQAKKFGFDNNGFKLSIPMSNDIESLNSSVATGICIYEMCKQFKELNSLENSIIC